MCQLSIFIDLEIPANPFEILLKFLKTCEINKRLKN